VGPHTAMTKIMGLFLPMDKMVGPDFEKGLTRLRAEAEAAGGHSRIEPISPADRDDP
jgi:hypothetical protein